MTQANTIAQRQLLPFASNFTVTDGDTAYNTSAKFAGGEVAIVPISCWFLKIGLPRVMLVQASKMVFFGSRSATQPEPNKPPLKSSTLR